MMLSVILLSMLMMLLSTINVIRHLICGSNQNWLLNLNLIHETLDAARKWLVVFNAGKAQLVFAVEVKMDGSVLEEKLSFNPLSTNLIKW